MSELRIVFDGPPGAVSGRFVEVETPDGASVNAGEWHERDDGLWELRISIPGADAVVTPQGLEDAAEELRERVADKDVTLNYPWSHLDTHQRGYWREDVRAVLEAAGIEVVDEGPLRVQEYPESQAVLVDGGLVELQTGDTIFIKRAATGKENTSTTSTRSADVLKDGAGIDKEE